MTSPSTSPPEGVPKLTTHPYLGVAGVLLGAMVATCTGRLMSVGLADIRGALHLGVDEASWLNTSFNASMMFISPHSTGSAATGRAAELLALQVRQQAFTLAISDSFLLIAMCCVVCLVIVAFMSMVPTQYRQIIASSPEAK